jgi:hypothetical protein
LIPEAIPGRDARDVVTAVADYTKLDRADALSRIRLNSTAMSVRNLGNERVATRAPARCTERAHASVCSLVTT